MAFISLQAFARSVRSAETLGCMLLVAAVFAGKLDLARLLPSSGEHWWLELRLWTLAASLVLLWPYLPRSTWRARITPGLTALLALLAWLCLRGAANPGAGAIDKSVDMLYLLAQALLMVLADRRQLAWMAFWAVVVAVVLFLLAAAGVSRPELNGAGWAPIGGPTTFYRIEFLAFCLCWVFYATWGQRAWPVAALSTLFLFGAMASLSKVALPAAGLVLLVFGARHLQRRDWRGLACVLGAALCTLIAWHFTMSDAMNHRLARAGTMARAPASAPGELQPGTDFEITFRYCVGVDPQSQATIAASSECRTRIIIDRSSRLLFAAEALRGFVDRPLWGHGLGSFELHMPNPQTGLPEVYTYPHNLLLEVAFEAGTPGLLLLLTALALVLRDAARVAPREPAAIYLAGYIVFIFLSTLVSGDFYDSRLVWLVAFALVGLARPAQPRIP